VQQKGEASAVVAQAPTIEFERVRLGKYGFGFAEVIA
jgi:hypothetical protein